MLQGIDLAESLDREIGKPPRMLPQNGALQALSQHRPKAVTWVQNVVSGRFMPSPEETVAVSKVNHGVRPVAVWDLPTRVLYGALAMHLESSLPSVKRGQAQWAAFKRTPLDLDGSYIIATDIASCYQYIDHNLLMDELRLQMGEPAVVNTLGDLLSATQGRTYGIPQQSTASDLLAEALLNRLERVLLRRGIQAGRYNDDFRFTCRSWSETVRALKIFAEETRRLGLTMNDLKTITWKRSTYKEALDDAENLRKEIAAEAQYDLTLIEFDPYGDVADSRPPDPTDVDREAAARIIERWAKVGGRSQVARARVKEHRASARPGVLGLGDAGDGTHNGPGTLEDSHAAVAFRPPDDAEHLPLPCDTHGSRSSDRRLRQALELQCLPEPLAIMVASIGDCLQPGFRDRRRRHKTNQVGSCSSRRARTSPDTARVCRPDPRTPRPDHV